MRRPVQFQIHDQDIEFSDSVQTPITQLEKQYYGFTETISTIKKQFVKDNNSHMLCSNFEQSNEEDIKLQINSNFKNPFEKNINHQTFSNLITNIQNSNRKPLQESSGDNICDLVCQKIQYQYELLKSKLKQKQVIKRQLNMQHRLLKSLQKSHNYQQSLQTSQILPRYNPMSSKRIKNKIINPSSIKPYPPQNLLSIPFDQVSFTLSNSIMSNLTKSQNQPIQSSNMLEQQTARFIGIDQQSDLIKRMSQELKKMEFKRIQEIAKGNWNHLRKM